MTVSGAIYLGVAECVKEAWRGDLGRTEIIACVL
jgi:hypothetical protein